MAKKILGFQIDVVGTSENKQKIGELTQEIQKLADIKSKLDEKIKSGESLSKNQELQYGKTTAAIKFLQGEKNKLITTQVNEVRSINAVDKSYNSLVAQNAKLSQQLRALADPLGKDKAEFDKLSGAIKKNTDNLKTMDEAMGRSFRNVGDYAGGITKAAGELGLFGNVTATVQGAMKQMKAGFDILKIGFTSMKGIIASTGIGLLVIGLASLIEYFTKTREGAKLLERGIAAVGAVFTVLSKHLADIGGKMVAFVKSAFEDPQQALKDFGNAILENVINRFKAFGVIINAIVNRDLQGLTDGFVQLGTGITDASVKGKKLLKEVGEEIVENVKNTDRLTISNQNLRDAERSLNLERAKSQSKIEALKLLADDQTKSEDARIEAAKQAFALENKLLQQSISFYQQKLDNAILANKLSGAEIDNEENLNKINEAAVALENAKAESYRKQKEELTKLNTLEKQKEDRLIEARKGEKEYAEFKEKEAEEAREKELKDDADFYEKLSKQNAEQAEKDKKAAIASGEETAAAKKALEEQIAQAAIDVWAGLADAQIQIQQQNLDRQYDNRVKNLDAQKEAGLITETEYNKSIEKLKKQKFKDDQALAVKQVAIDTAIAVVKTFIDYGGFTPQAVIAAAAMVAAGATQIGVIKSQKYARGGIVQGGGSGTSDSINARLSNGEFVMNAKSTAAFAPMLNAMNMAGGGRNSFAGGGIVSPVSTSGISSQLYNQTSSMNFDTLAVRIVNGINDKKVYLKEVDVTTSQKTVSTILASSKF